MELCIMEFKFTWYLHICDIIADDEFSQGLILPPLVIQLKKILDQYSDDTQILKVSRYHHYYYYYYYYCIHTQ